MNNLLPVLILNEVIILPNQEIKIDLNNEFSKKVIWASAKNELNKVLVIAPINTLESSPSIEDLPRVGVVAKVKSKVELPNNKLRVIIKGEERVSINKYYQNKNTNVLKCSFNVIELPSFSKANETAIQRKLIELTKNYILLNKNVSNSILKTLDERKSLSDITDIITSFLPFSFSKKLSYMETINPLTRAENLINDLNEEILVTKIDRELDEKLTQSIENGQREFILKEKLKEINSELGITKENEIASLKEKLSSLSLEEKTYNKLLNEINKYSTCSEFSPEAAVIKNYLDTVLNLPWNSETVLNTDIKKIKNELDATHYGLVELKERICEYAYFLSKNKELSAPVICLLGAPGVGKTSSAYSIAKALNREFIKISVGGLNDSTELIGSRRTYLGASAGKIMQGIIKCKVKNPVILIDEVDKMVKDYKGDPASTLLEILDSTQNKYFIDNYIEEPFDLSKVMFILTANSLDNIPSTLLDRLEIINMDNYLTSQKIDIAKNYLIKDIFSEYKAEIKISKEVLEFVIENYTKEPGVRELKRLLEKLIRKVIVNEPNAKSITILHVNKYLDNRNINYLPEITTSGIANILAYTTVGGRLSHIEVVKYKGTGKVTITGCAGEILKDSINVVISYLANNYNIDLKNQDLHFHFLESYVKKDGPSAGVSIAVALMSLIKNKKISSQIAFTGELSLKGDILPVGGLKEKVVVATTEGITKVFVPSANAFEVANISENITNNIEIVLVSNFTEIYDALFK
ncbi:MAG: endopeptidase La [Bacilli bacterium]|nr:endopeptidase La [Bacilli bacterium]MDY4618761.1 endopeptidase La [Bacilli bacterium]